MGEFDNLEGRIDELEGETREREGIIGIMDIHRWINHVEEHGTEALSPEEWAPPGVLIPTAQEAIDDYLCTDWDWREEYPVLGKHVDELTYPELFAIRYHGGGSPARVLERLFDAEGIDVEAFNADLRAEEGEP